MQFTEGDKDELFRDLKRVTYIKGNLNKTYKYKAHIPRDIWNKWRIDKLTRNDYKVIQFGRPGYQQYKDKLGGWTRYDHLDKKRRQNYRARHEPIRITIKNKKYISYRVPFTNEFFSYYLMW